VSAEKYYLQDSRSFVGNCVMFWAEGGRGYTTDIDAAHIFTKEQAFAQNKCRDTDKPIPCSIINPLARKTIDVQDLHETQYFEDHLKRKK
jgi:hypothetical protein